MIQIDIDMPEKCGLCPLFHAEHPMYCQGVKADRKKKIVAPYRDPRPDWCPLHEADSDTINRRQAIDALFGILDRPNHADFLYTDEIAMALNQLPPSPNAPKTLDNNSQHAQCVESVGDDDFEKQIHFMFDHIWDCEIDHPIFQDTVGDLMDAVIQCHKKSPTPSRRHGQWIKGKMWSEGIGMGETYGFYYTCSECNSSVKGGYDKCGKNFCSNCGADMRETEHE